MLDCANVKPLHHLVIVKPEFSDKKSEGGILLPYTSIYLENGRLGTVKALGPDVECVKVGDRVLYHQDQEQKFLSDKEHKLDPHYIMDSRMIDAIVDKDCNIR